MSTTIRALRQPAWLRLTSASALSLWLLVAAFPIFWITMMSVKVPLDAFADSPLEVIFGPRTLQAGKGLTILDLLGYGLFLFAAGRAAMRWLPRAVPHLSLFGAPALGWLIGILALAVSVGIAGFHLLPALLGALNGALGLDPLIGFTAEHYRSVWIGREFWQNVLNSVQVTLGVTAISLMCGTLAGYALSRSGSTLAFWLLILALIFRALPHSVLVTGYLPVFINSAEILRPILGDNAPTLYGQPLAVIAVLVAINQPFTIWMLRSFFLNIPADLDEAARVDGCTHFQAFRWVIMPVMWPGVITTGLFSFLLGYNDFLVTSLLLDQSNMTMVPAIASFFNRETTTTDQVQAVAAAVSITAPLFLLVMVFQRQIVSGLTQGAVKG
ncbi:carbohydrate ABC transporter permease [Paracoccus spongiarum]|uniref:Carbohydrate ABC transporter permease n=1 Tax=Paracoccus spongiarum TaxID=3064387 RepID=A0ABT9JIN6_9RHOB|nr:carbohydrate ABC transporter permease [Paracoccus sp. 2205BS29-5]MDP5308912.1 carbohydrate ABC transporter permease [Paracoccus sp. 2205BS29-5]